LTALLRLSPGRPTLGSLAYAFPLAAVAGGALASRRSRFAAPVAVFGLLSLLEAWGANRAAWVAPRPGLPLAGAALACALLTGAGLEAVADLRRRTFGVPHLASAAAAAFLVIAVAAGVGWFVRGDYPELGTRDGLAPAFVAADTASVGQFRVLWLGGPAPGSRALRLDVTDPSGETMLGFALRRESPAQTYLENVVAGLIGGRSQSGGRLLAPLGIRQIIARPGTPPAVLAALDSQVDVRYRQTFRGAGVYDNVAALPVAAALPAGAWSRASREADPFGAVVSVDAAGSPSPGLAQTGPARFRGRLAPGTTTVVLAEPFDPRWRLLVGGASVKPRPSFGFATAFDLPSGIVPPAPAPKKVPKPAKTPAGKKATAKAAPSPKASATPAPRPKPGPVAVAVWRGQTGTRFLLLIQLGLWIVFAAGWSGRRAIERGER
jgi:hypothetical protein